jgi:hypothetical protein
MTRSTSNKPTHIAWHVTDRNDKSFWTRIGVAWQHKDGNGFNIEFQLTPLDGRVTLRVATEKKDSASEAADAAPAEPIQL